MGAWSVYLINARFDDKKYVGITKHSLVYRFAQHKRQHRRVEPNRHSISAAFAKYGEAAFEIELLEEGLTLVEAQTQEQYWIQRFNTYAFSSTGPTGYNLTRGGEHPGPGPQASDDQSTAKEEGASVYWNDYSYWTREEEKEIADLHRDGKSVEQIATKMGRRIGAINNRLFRLGRLDDWR